MTGPAPQRDDREAFYPGQQGAIRTNWLGYRPSPRRLRDARPVIPGDLSPAGACWYWNPERRYWMLIYASALDPDDLWLPYQAIADPGNLP